MKLYSMITLCLVTLLPCILGDSDDCVCKFPIFMSGKILDDGFVDPFAVSFKDNIFRVDVGSEVWLVDFKNKVKYEEFGTECIRDSLNNIEGFYPYIFPNCVPKMATQCASNTPGIKCYSTTQTSGSDTIMREYQVSMTGTPGECKPTQILVTDGSPTRVDVVYNLTAINKGTDEDAERFSQSLKAANSKSCDRDDLTLG